MGKMFLDCSLFNFYKMQLNGAYFTSKISFTVTACVFLGDTISELLKPVSVSISVAAGTDAFPFATNKA
jgi:hypothetical protein